jgi:nucleolar protein 4
MSTLGKRKADSDAPETVETSETAVNTETTSAIQDASSETHGSTLFVSNLPYAATSVDLQTLFSDLAPVRTAFVVTEQGTGVSKGVGYVSFAAKEDAQGAFEQVQKEGLKITGRNLRVAWADIKVSLRVIFSIGVVI